LGRTFCALSLAACLLFGAGSAGATPGSLDRSFGVDGIGGGPLADQYAVAEFVSVVSQPDGGVAAKLDRNNGGATVLMHYGADGSADPGLPPEPVMQPEPVEATQEDGKRLVGGSEGCCLGGWLERRNPDGSPDAGFGTGGKSASVPFTIKEIVPLPSGRILVAGAGVYAYESKSVLVMETEVARFQSDGSLDPGFGAGGVVKFHTDFGIQATELLATLPRAGGGVVVGLDEPISGGEADSALIGLTSAGQLDPTFGDGGQAVQKGLLIGVHALGNGDLLVAGSSGGARLSQFLFDSNFSLARYTSQGQLDAGFGKGGRAIADFGGADKPKAVLWSADGTISIGGASIRTTPGCLRFGGCPETPVLARFTPAGDLDPSFGSAGLLTLSELANDGNGGEEGVLALDARPGGGVVAGGGSGPVAFLAALTPTGATDSSFGTNGIVRESFPLPSTAMADAIALDGRGRILIGGSTNAGSTGVGAPFATVIRYRPNGGLDTSYGDGKGFVRLPSFGQRRVVAVDRRGRAVLMARESNVLSRATASGHLDSSFGAGGVATVRLGVPSVIHPELQALAALPNGKVLAAGQIRLGKGPRMLVVRLNQDGRLDRSFGSDGRRILAFRHRGACDALQIAVQPDGHLVLAGYVRRGNARSPRGRARFALVRLSADGSLDRGFGHRGFAVAPFRRRGEATAIAMQGRKILVAGRVRENGRWADVLVRYGAGGRLDRTFARRGVARIASGKGGSWLVLSLLATPDRVVVVRDDFEQPVVAFGRNGRLDRHFGEGTEIAPKRVALGFAAPGPLGVLQDGKLVLGWTAEESTPTQGRELPRLQRLTLR
jgi:uncharacterized delta-60 repeat protein